MRPWQHAKSSAGKSGDWQADLPIHEFMDSTKVACPDIRHRMVLHNADLGPDLAARAFPNRPDAREIALRHVHEDLGCTPALSDWLAGCDHALFPRPLHRRMPPRFDQVAAQLARAQGLASDEGPQAVVDLLLIPVQLAGPSALAILFNGAAPALVRSVLGGPYEARGSHGGVTIFDPSHAAEATIHWLFGTIPSLSDAVAALRRPPHRSENP